MPLRITTLSLDGEAVTDVPDNSLVLDMYFRLVKPEAGTVILLYKPGANCPIQYAESIEDVVDTTSGVDVISVTQIDTIQYSDLPIVHVDAECTINQE